MRIAATIGPTGVGSDLSAPRPPLRRRLKMPSTSALEFLALDRPILPAVVAAFGADRTLRRWSIAHRPTDEDVTELDGESLTWRDVRDELQSNSLFTIDETRCVIVRTADALIKSDRAAVEDYVAQASPCTRLVLDLDQLPSNTRLYKAIEKEHLLISCAVPTAGKGRFAKPDSRTLGQFLSRYVAPRHQTRLSAGAAETLLEFIGTDVGMLDSAIAKLAVHLPPDATITETLVREVVSGWIGKSIWEINDAVASGNASEALRHLDKLISGGQRPIALFPQMAWSLRQLAMATAVVDQLESLGKRPTPRDGLTSIGLKGGPSNLQKSEAQMKQLGRVRARKLHSWLLKTDLRLKGSHSSDGPDRRALEELVCKLARQSTG